MKIISNIVLIYTLLTLPLYSTADELAQWALADSQKADEEFLLYRLSYSGFFTAYVWKDLADLVITADNRSGKFNQTKSCQLHLKMSTENYSISELFSPMRYHWRSTVNPELNRVFMFEEINENDDDIHELVWINKNKKRLEFYHKRKKITPPSDDEEALSDDDFYDAAADETPVLTWEEDGKINAPHFLLNKPAFEGNRSYLVYDQNIFTGGKPPIFDPLSLIYSARWHDYTTTKKHEYTLSHEDTFRVYQVRMEAKEPLEIENETVSALKIAITRKADEARDNEGYMILWLSNDERRIPLQYHIETKLGTIKVKLDTPIKNNYQKQVSCISHKPVTVPDSLVKGVTDN